MTRVRAPLDVTLAAAGLGLCLAIGFASPGVEAAGGDAPAAAGKASAPSSGVRRVAPPAPAASKVQAARRAASSASGAATRATAAASRPIDGMKWDALDPKTVPPVPDAPRPAPAPDRPRR